MIATSIEARAVNTLAWLRDVTEVAVPVYQRHYRWDVERCSRLLNDIRSTADDPPETKLFLGTILATEGPGPGGFVVVDGQQRITTLTLMIAALRRTWLDAGEPPVDGLDDLLYRAGFRL